MYTCGVIGEKECPVINQRDAVKQPWFLIDPSNVVAEVGQRAFFEAQATGQPMPTVKWSVVFCSHCRFIPCHDVACLRCLIISSWCYSSDGDRTVTRGNPFKLSVNYCRTNTRKNFFRERVVKVWNSLPPTIVNFSSLATFKNSVNKINLRIYIY